MSKDPLTNTNLASMVRAIKESRKYRGAGIPDATLEDVLRREWNRHPKPADALRSAKAVLHNIMAPYLGDPDYAASEKLLDAAFAAGDDEVVRQAALVLLAQHDSTKERLAYMEDFYSAIRAACPNAEVILDLACGLNPFAIPFMGLPGSVRYHAYDLHQPRVTLINRFLKGLGMEALAEARDILLAPPQIEADAAFLFKEAHRLEKRRKGASKELAGKLKARVIFISLPNRSLDGRRNLSGRMDALVRQILAGRAAKIQQAEFPGETLYWVERENG